jgi:membrane protease YdiL (CAAX protease family)
MLSDSSKSPKAGQGGAGQFAHVSWGPFSGALMVVVSMVVGQLLATILIIVSLMFLRTSHDAAASWTQSTVGQFIFVVCAEAITIGLLLLFLRRRHATYAAVGFLRTPRLSDGAYAVVAGVVYFAILIVVTALASASFNINVDQKQDIGFTAVAGHFDLILTFFSLVILPPIVEETLFRGVLYGGLRTKLRFIWAALITSVLFAVPHLLQGGDSLLWVGAIDTFVLSLVLCYLRERTRSLWAGMVLHMLKNGLAFLFLFVFAAK